MNGVSIGLWLRIAVIALICIFLRAGPVNAADQSSSSCERPEYHQFDFWIGDWDTYDVDHPDQVIARNRVDRILGGCVLREDYQQNDGMNGQSFNIYDESRKVWRQNWVTNRGKSLTLEGSFQAGAMVLEGTALENGKETRIRGTWKVVERGVRETAVKSIDAGKSWTPWFDIIFRPHQVSATQLNEDQTSVAALDSEYQAAVKANDAATMDHILADDFVLVTGSGRTYSKANLLDDARRKHEVYEHQEDTDRTVRLYGDTAIVTARLWEKGTAAGKPFDYTVWFSDTYVRTPAGWRYVFGQSSLPLP